MAIEGISELRKYIQNVGKAAKIAAQGSRVTAIQKSNAIIKTRVFTKGLGDAEGNLLKPYSDAYKKIRKIKDLQIERKDLQFSGELFKSIQPVITEKVASLEIKKIQYKKDGANTQEVAKYQEKAQGEKIFKLSDSEYKDFIGAYEFQFKKEFKRLVDVS